MTQPRLYSVDTSALIDGLERYYPEEAFPALWKEVDRLIEARRFLMSEEVWREAHVHTTNVAAWCDRRRKDDLVVPTDAAVVAEVQSILATHQRLVMDGKGRNRADPFVIAVARIKGATVITGEGDDGNERRPKIPYICRQLGVDCMRLLWTDQERGLDVLTPHDGLAPRLRRIPGVLRL